LSLCKSLWNHVVCGVDDDRLRLRDFEFGDYKGVETLLYPVSYWGCAE
jgi:hypothetical protein